MRLGEAVAYVVRPRWTAERAPVDAEGLRHLIVLFLATAALVVFLAPFLRALIVSLAGGSPANANNDLIDMSPGRMILIGMVAAPLIEEVLFRGWLGGARTSLAGLPMLAAVFAALAAMSAMGGVAAVAMAAVLGFLGTVVGMRAMGLGDAEAQAARERLFPVVFWGSAAIFALAHTLNYTGIDPAALEEGQVILGWPLLALAVLLQGLVGLVLGYVRMRFGLVSAIFFHAAYNALFLSLSLLATGLAEVPPPPA